jgi:hypothetical protein
VTFNQPGSCVIDANHAGNAKYQPAPQTQTGNHGKRRHEKRPDDLLFRSCIGVGGWVSDFVGRLADPVGDESL